MQIPLANIHWRFLLVRDDWGFQVNPLCRHDITSPFPPSGNEGYVRNRDVFSRNFLITLFSVLIFLDSFLMAKLNCINQKVCLIN